MSENNTPQVTTEAQPTPAEQQPSVVVPSAPEGSKPPEPSGVAENVTSTPQLTAEPEPEAPAKAQPTPPAEPEPEASPKQGEVDALAEQLKKQAEQLKATAEQTAQLKAQLKAAAVEKLGILPAYRADVPEFDVTTDEGKAGLEAWAAARPEIRATQPVAAVPTQQAEKYLTNLKSPHLVDADWFREALAEA